MLSNQVVADCEAQMSLGLSEITDGQYVPDKNYEPGASVQTVSSKGQMWRVKSRTTGRIVQLLSLLEYIVFLILDLDPRVVDIEEQYKHDLQSSLKVAFEQSINHPPQNQKEKVPLTTDFVVTLASVDAVKFGVYVNYIKDLANYRTLEKFQLERASMAKMGIPLYIVTEEQIDRKKHLSLEWITGASLDVDDIAEVNTYAEPIDKFLRAKPKKRLAELLTELDKDCDLEKGSHLYRFKQLIQLGVFTFDLKKPFQDLYGSDIQSEVEVKI